jgi:dipeptidyl aminopeptidase/acylaminoacyl peptidase
MAACSRRPTWSRLGAGVAVAVLSLSACGSGSDDDSDSSGTPPAASVPAGPTGRLMFSRFEEATHTFISTHITQADGSGETELSLPGPEGGGRWSHSGELIAVMTILEDERIGTAIIKPDGTVERTLDVPDPTLNLVCVVWSRDDKRLACEGWDDSKPARKGIYTVRAADGGDLKRLTSAPAGLGDFPGDYSPDGKTFVFKRSADESNGPLMLVDVAGGAPRRLSAEQFEDDGRFSPDGTSVLSSGNGTIMVVDLNGTVAQRITKPGTFGFGPVWSPDGEWVAFSRGTDGPFADVFVARPDGSEEFQVTDTPVNEIALDWGPS